MRLSHHPEIIIIAIGILLILVSLPACQDTPTSTLVSPSISPAASPTPEPPPSQSINGRVVADADNSPLQDVTVTINNSQYQKIRDGLTDKQGRYLIADLPVGEYMVTAKSTGYRYELYDGADANWRTPQDKIRKVSVSEDRGTSGIDFRLKKLAVISGRVFRADNKQPLGWATVAVYGPHWSFGPITTLSMTEGRYEVTGLNQGESTLACEAKGYVTQYYSGTYDPLKKAKITTDYGQVIQNIDFYLEPGGSISGTVFEPDGKTPAVQSTKPGNDFKETQVGFFQISGIKTPVLGGDLPTPNVAVIYISPDGTYRIEGLLTGDYDLMSLTRFANGALTSAHQKVSVVTGKETKGINLVALPGGSVSGHVYLPDRITPAEGLNIAAMIENGYPEGGSYYSGGGMRISPDGSYSLGPLASGTVYLSPSGNIQYAGKLYPVTVVSGKNTVFDIYLTNN